MIIFKVKALFPSFPTLGENSFRVNKGRIAKSATNVLTHHSFPLHLLFQSCHLPPTAPSDQTLNFQKLGFFEWCLPSINLSHYRYLSRSLVAPSRFAKLESFLLSADFRPILVLRKFSSICLLHQGRLHLNKFYSDLITLMRSKGSTGLETSQPTLGVPTFQ